MQKLHDVMQSGHPAVSMHPETEVGTVTFKVADLSRSLNFYNRVIGLKTFKQEGRMAVLGAGHRTIMILEEVPGAQRQAAGTTGLYHAAILFPDRHALAIKIAQIDAARIPLGFSDHLVSEAFYLSDPDDNGLELYRDRPRKEWTWENGRVRMATDPIDFEGFYAEIKDENPGMASPNAPDGTRLGHVHLRVADIPTAEAFYHEVLGFDVTARLPGALFVSAGGYHHHIGMNTWESRGGKPPLEPSVGLREFSITQPDQDELDRLIMRIEAAGVSVERGQETALLEDPFRNRIKLIVGEK